MEKTPAPTGVYKNLAIEGETTYPPLQDFFRQHFVYSRTLVHFCQAVMQGTSPAHCAMVIPQRSLGTSWIRRLQKGVDRMNEHGSISDPCHSWSNQHDNENSTLKSWWRKFPSSRCPICLAGFHLVSREVSGTSSLPADVKLRFIGKCVCMPELIVWENWSLESDDQSDQSDRTSPMVNQRSCYKHCRWWLKSD